MAKRDKSYYIGGDIDISEPTFSLPMPPTSHIMHQGALSPSCVAHAVTMAVMVAIRMQTGKWIKLSPYSLHARLANNGGGTSMRYIVEALDEYGMLPTSEFSARGDNPKLHEELMRYIDSTAIAAEIFAQYKGVDYADLRSFDDVKKALKSGYTVVGAVRTSKGFGMSNGGYEPKYPRGTDTYHAIEFNGWTIKDGKEYLIAINSHGASCGDKGKVYIPRGRLLKDLALIDYVPKGISHKAERIELRLGDNNTYMKHDRVFLPVRFVAENLGCVVEWQAERGTATIISEEATIVLTTDSNIITINGKTTEMDAAPEIVEERMMLPIRHVAEALNCNVEWHADTHTAVITAL